MILEVIDIMNFKVGETTTHNWMKLAPREHLFQKNRGEGATLKI